MKKKWQILLAFLLGMVVAELSADPTDWLFTQKAEQVGMQPLEVVLYWYILTASFYAFICLIAFLSAKSGVLEPQHIIYILMGLVVLGFIRNYQLLTVDIQSFGSRIAIVVALSATVISLGLLYGMKKRVD